ncbi:MAG: hypothetical protein ACFFE6_05310 [Candidatus Thorarchaeota archaeon]
MVGRRKDPSPEHIQRGKTVEIKFIYTMAQLESELSLLDEKEFENLIIHLNTNFKEHLSLDFLFRLSNLKRIMIRGGSYKEIDMTSVNECASLEYMRIAQNPEIEEIDMRILLEAPRIRGIHIVDNKSLRNIRMDNIGDCKSLRFLRIVSGRFNPDLFHPDILIISKCKGLRGLAISTNDDSIDLTPLVHLQELVHLSIEHHADVFRWIHEPPDFSVVPPMDCTPLLSLPNLLVFKNTIKMFDSGGFRRISLPILVSQECGKTWLRVNETQSDIVYAKLPKEDWKTTYVILQEYASFFAPIYWLGLNRYILKACGIERDRYQIDISRCVIPTDLLRLVEPTNRRRPNTKIVKERLDENIVDMVARYLDGEHSTKGFDIEKIISDKSMFDQFIPRIQEIRVKEIRDVVFIQYSKDNRLGDNYYIHSLLDTVYGQQAFEERGFVLPRNQTRKRYTLTKNEIDQIRQHLNDIETDWKYITMLEYIYE